VEGRPSDRPGEDLGGVVAGRVVAGRAVAGRVVVGRDRALDQLDQRLSESASGRGGTVLVTGEPGIGKSHLAEEVGRRAALRGCRVAWGRCRETGGAPAYWPWTQVLRRLDVRCDPASSDPVQLLLGGRLAPGSSSSRFRVFDAAARALVAAASERPLLLVLEDLHRADEPSLLLLEHLCGELRQSALLLLGTFRDTEAGPAHLLARIVGDAVGGLGTDVLTLGPLTREDTARLVAGQTGRAAPALSVAELHRRCGGNPFFLTELLRLPPELAGSVPATVSAAITLRVGRLPAATRRTLTLGAVLGRELRLDLLAALTGDAPRQVETHLAPALAAGLLQPAEDTAGGYRFRHVLVRDALYDALPALRRAELHDLVVRALLAHQPAGLGGASDVASHAVRVQRTPQERRRAVRLAALAAAEARDRLAHEAAAGWSARALAVGTDDPAARLRLLLELGTDAGRAGQLQRARSAYEQAWALATAEGWDDRLPEVALALGEFVDSAGTVDAGLVRMLERSLERLSPADRSTSICLTARLAVEVYWSPRLDEARRLSRDAVAAARRLGSRRELAVALSAQQFALRGPGHLSERMRLGQELVAQARALRDEPLELQAQRLLLLDLLQCDPAAAEAGLRALDALATETRRPLARWYVMVNQCLRAGMAGRPERALALVAETEAFGRRIGVGPAGMYATVVRWRLLRECGRGGESEAALRAASLDYPRLANLRCALTVLLAESGQEDEAAALLAELTADDCRAVPADALRLSSLALLTVAGTALRRVREAAVLQRALQPHSGQVVLQGVVAWEGAVDHYLGLLATTLGRYDEAERALTSGLRLHEAWGAVPLVRASLDGLAALRGLRTAGGGDGAEPTCRPRVAGLTPREREVLALLAAGAANKQIARRLDISVNTVERHVSNVYAKIGASNRAAATAVALGSAPQPARGG
jgi:DNA-binding CsgD family transcriptional regulator